MTNQNRKPQKPLRLPFEKRKGDKDFGTWIYRHRIGLLSTVVVFLVSTISFLSYRIVLNSVPTEMIAIEFEKEQEKPPAPEEIEKIKEIQRLEAEAEKVQNKISDQNSKLNASLRDAKNSNASEIYKEMERVNRQLADGKQSSDRGMGEASEKQNQRQKPQNNNNDKSATESNKNQRERVQGNVFVSYDLPGRTDVYLHIPAYQCQYAGVVVVNITVNKNGKVTSAKVDKATSTSDGCIERMAVQSAQGSTFSSSSTAPDRQSGTITYRFVAQ